MPSPSSIPVDYFKISIPKDKIKIQIKNQHNNKYIDSIFISYACIKNLRVFSNTFYVGTENKKTKEFHLAKKFSSTLDISNQIETKIKNKFGICNITDLDDINKDQITQQRVKRVWIRDEIAPVVIEKKEELATDPLLTFMSLLRVELPKITDSTGYIFKGSLERLIETFEDQLLNRNTMEEIKRVTKTKQN